MVDLSQRSVANSLDDSREGPRHPLAAGILAVSLVALLVVLLQPFVDEGVRSTTGVLAGLAGLVAVTRLVTSRRRTHPEPTAPSHLGRERRGVRRHRRYVPVNAATTLYVQDGRRIPARIANISVAAVAVEAAISDLDYRSVVRIGSRGVSAIRQTATGAVFGFDALLDPQPFDGSFVL